jgi:hypothetical protein
MAGDERCGSVRPGRRTSKVAFGGEAPGEDDPLLGFAPFMHVAPRGNSITPARQRAFIAALAASGIVTQAARVVGVSLEALYRLRNRPGAQGFAQAWDEAVDRGMARLEDCALERAIAGEERLIVRGGEVVARWTRYDTQLLVFLLRNRRGGRYRAEAPSRRDLREARIGDQEAEARAVLASIDAKIDRMRARWLAEQKAED